MAVTKVVMPKLSEQMETGKIIKWLKQEGDRVQAGDILAEVETDKADVEMEAFGSGVLRKILVPPGERAPVGSLIAVIAEPNEDIASVIAGAPAPAAAPGKPTTAGNSETINGWDWSDAERARRDVERVLKDEVKADWSEAEVDDLVNDVLYEGDEDGEDEEDDEYEEDQQEEEGDESW